MENSPPLKMTTNKKIECAWSVTPTVNSKVKKRYNNNSISNDKTPITPNAINKDRYHLSNIPPSQTKSALKIRNILKDQGFEENVARHASVTCKTTVSAAVQYALDYQDHILQSEEKIHDETKEGEGKKENGNNKNKNMSKYQLMTSSRRFQYDSIETNMPISNVALQKKLLAQGFSKLDVNRAVRRCNTVESAINYILEWEEIAEATDNRRFECALCMDDEIHGDEIVTLSCNHRFCRSCLKFLLELKLKEKHVTDADLCCPHQNCNVPLDLKIIEATIGEALYQKLLDVKLRRMYLTNTKDARECPKCSHIMIIEESDTKLLYDVTCPGKECGHRFCGKCGEKPHTGQKDIDLSCEKYADFLRKNDEGLKQFKEFMKTEGLRQCPKCRRVGELKSGCKFVYCPCKSNYCYLCGRELAENQHYSHFHNGPYGKRCYGGGIDKKGRVAEPRCIKCKGPDCEKCMGAVQELIDKETEKEKKREEARKNRRGLWAYLFGRRKNNKKK